MRDFACPHCGQRLAFENSLCLSCNNPIGFDLVEREFAILGPDGVTTRRPRPADVREPATSRAATGWCRPTGSRRCAGRAR